MAPRPPKPCKKHGCNKITREVNGYCADHQEYAAALEVERAKRGDQRRGSASERGYGGYWRKVRDRHLWKHPLCEVCGKRPYRETMVVHHKDENPRNNSDENLMTMCNSCHERHHGRKK